MASVFHLCCDAFEIKRRVLETYSNFAAIDKKLYVSAVTIQKTWRGYIARQLIKDWHKKVTFVQKYVRGWLVRRHLPELLKEYYDALSIKYYHNCATKIQALWRGYRTRKTTLSLRALLHERSAIEAASSAMKEQMKKLFEKLRTGPLSEKYQYLEQILKMLFDRHHLLRTTITEGIFSIHGSTELSCIEKILKSFRFTAYMKELHALLDKENLHKSISIPEIQERFDLNTHIQEKPYEKMMLTRD
ncbi:uncharacterized protein LOC135135463 isoform X2 [Zophobas morio]|uniref:uncharacterized protein LOC135135463 isoform X2 n=1 Tax=Zophobas morio TaxID=2755281 RepID=UPI0030837907